jgi:hypothetical protein
MSSQIIAGLSHWCKADPVIAQRWGFERDKTTYRELTANYSSAKIAELRRKSPLSRR